MKKKHIILFLTIVICLGLSQSVLALELEYPSLRFGAPLGNRPSLVQFIEYAFIFALVAAGIIGVMSIVISGFQILISAGNPTARSDAMDRIRGAILGIILLFLSFILLGTINPALVSPMNPSGELRSGVYTRSPGPGSSNRSSSIGGYEYETSNQFVADTALRPEEDMVFYFCEDPGPHHKQVLLYAYSKINFEIDRSANGDPNVTTYELTCGDVPTVYVDPTTPYNAVLLQDSLAPIFSYQWEIKDSGVYYYLKENCEGIAAWYNDDSPAQKNDGDLPWFDADYDNVHMPRSMKIVNSRDDDFDYGVVFNASEKLEGECSEPIFNKFPITENENTADVCVSINDSDWPSTLLDNQKFKPYSAMILKNPRFEPPSYFGVTFWSPNLQSTLNQVDPNDSAHEIRDIWVYEDDGTNDEGNLDYLLKQDNQQWREPNVSLPPNECAPNDPTFTPYLPSGDDNPDYKGYRSCVNWITTDGSYSTIIYTKNEETSDLTCQSFYGTTSLIKFGGGERIFNHSQRIYRTVVYPSVP